MTSREGVARQRLPGAGRLRPSESLYRLIVESSRDLIFLFDLEGGVVYASPSVESVLGRSAATLEGTSVFEIVHPEDVALGRSALGQAIGEGTAFVAELRLSHVDGRWIPVDGVGTSILSEEGEAELVLGIARDIGERKEAETALRDSRELYRLVVEASDDLVGLIDLEGRVLYASPSHERKLGYPPDALLGGEILSLVHPDDAVDVQAAIAAALDGGRATLPEFRLRHADGRWLTLKGAASAVVDDEGRPKTLVVTASDISGEKLATAERERRERADREFIANAAHELRTPITAIMAAVDVLQGGAKEIPAERDSFLADLEREAARLNRLVHSLLMLARVQAVRAELPVEPVELRPLLAEIAEGLGVTEETEVRVICPRGVAVLAERVLLERALENLAANAAAHTARGHVSFAARPGRDGRVEVEISDTGTGIPSSERARVFERFYRVGGRDGSGSGLGLAIVQETVRALNGEVEIDSAPGAGTTVRLLLQPAGSGW